MHRTQTYLNTLKSLDRTSVPSENPSTTVSWADSWASKVANTVNNKIIFMITKAAT